MPLVKQTAHKRREIAQSTQGACELNSQVANDVEAVQLSQKEEATYHAVKTTGLLNIDISGFGQKTVYCDNGWLVVLRRTDNQVDFHRTWNEYRDGFGDPRDQFWLGNEALYGLTNQGNYSMQIDMKSCDGNYYYVKWNLFRIGAEADRYAINAITVESYNTSTNSYLVENLGWQFGTYDNDIGNTCSALHGGGWWYNDCVRWHLTGTYPVNCDTGAAGMKFASISGNNCNTACMLKAATMKIRRNS
ncbi:fibrinogen-like protein A [Lingula anatina]|uniref:Fibrinogen-like protein A n=1 Tax=Lingula anatina TaxID=7574 RepID=A0A1S3GZR8_LINAN|nr:fibrinogen-like protein A [Lingula anatina]|eukprot:XP_013379370.1 fibrinogen-like protein A [Lingula anatina]